MDERENNDKIGSFIQKLSVLDAGDRARLKRNAGKPLAESRNVLTLFYHLLPTGLPHQQEELYFLVATLYPVAEGGGSGDFGSALRNARVVSNSQGLDRRVEILLDSDLSQLPFRLRQAVHFLQSNRVRLNWPALLADLLYWSHPERFVQQRWAKSYFAK